MATKNDPGEFDCYARAEADEPLFTLRAKDPLAPALVRLWTELRALTTPLTERGPDTRAAHEKRKRAEALECAEAMEAWHAEHVGPTGTSPAGGPTRNRKPGSTQ